MSAPHIAYLRSWLLTALITIAAVAGINLAVDPYGIYDLISLDGFNKVKTRASQRALLSKTYNLAHVRPRSVILGNSRAEIGFDPNHPGWPAEGKPAYNFALPGAGLASNLRQLEYAIRSAQPQTVVMGVDFLNFTLDARMTNPELAAGAESSDVRPRAEWIRHASDYAEVLLSLDALGDSIRTILGQHNRYSTRLTDLGFNPLLDYLPIAKESGYRSMFSQRNRENARSYLRGGKDVFLAGTTDSPEFETLRILIARCRNANARLHLVIYPYHAHTLELFRAAGLWNAFEDWKRKLVQIADEAAAEGGSAQPFSVWDFSGYNSITTEAVPAQGDLQSEMRWYWEAGHFKKEAGDLVLDQLLGYRTSQLPQDFGTLLTAANIDAHLARIRADRERYAASHPGELAYLDRLMKSLK